MNQSKVYLVEKTVIKLISHHHVPAIVVYAGCDIVFVPENVQHLYAVGRFLVVDELQELGLFGYV